MNANLDKEIVEKLLSIDIHCKMNLGDDRVLHFTDFKNEKDSMLTFNRDEWGSSPKSQIIITINCDGYNVKVD